MAAALLGAQVVASELDFDKVGLTSAGGVDVARWAVLAPLWFVPLVVLVSRSASLPRVLWTRPQRYLTLWLVWALASVFWSVDPRQTLLQGTALVALWVTAVWFTSLWGFEAMARVFVAATTAFLLSGLALDLVTGGLGLGSGRADGLSFHATNVARVAVLSVVVAGWLLLRSQPGSRGWAWVAVPVGLLALVLSGSRVPLVALLVAGIYLLLRRLGIRWAIGVGASLVLLGLVVIAWVGSPTEVGGRDENPRDLGTLNGRTTIWAVGTDLVESRPLQGFGTASGELIWQEAARDGEISWLAVNAHNVVLEILVANGIVGLVLFGAGLVSYLRRAFGADAGRDAILLAVLVTGATEAVVNRPSSTVILLGALFVVASASATTATATATPAVPARAGAGTR